MEFSFGSAFPPWVNRVHASLIAKANCIGTEPIVLTFHPNARVWSPSLGGISGAARLDRFAVSDGFGDWGDLVAFWRKHHAEVGNEFRDRQIIYWGMLK